MVATIILNGAYVALVSASFTRAMVALRSVLIVAAVLLIAFGAMEGITSMVVWNIVIGGSHAVSLTRDVLKRRRNQLPAEQLAIAAETFPGLPLADTQALWAAGYESLGRDAQLTRTGESAEDVSLIIAGEVAIERDDKLITTLGAGSLVGEMSLARGGGASADAVALGPLWTRVWTKEALAELADTHPRAARAFTELVQCDLANKLARVNA